MRIEAGIMSGRPTEAQLVRLGLLLGGLGEHGVNGAQQRVLIAARQVLDPTSPIHLIRT